MKTRDPRTALQHRLRRIEGQVRGVQRMLDEERDCMEVLTQLSSIQAAVKRVSMHIIVENLENCLVNEEGDREESLARLRDIFIRLS